MVRTLDRYFVRQVVVPFAIVLLVFTFMLLMQPVMEVADELIAKGVSWAVIARILPTLLPQALALTIPMSLLIGLLIAFGRLSEDREWTALQACGVSSYRLLTPLAALSLVCWATTSYMIIVALPSSNQAYREISYDIVSSKAENDIRPRVFFDDFNNLNLYVRKAAPGGGWQDVFLADTSKPVPDILMARTGRMVVDRSKRTVDLLLEDQIQHVVQPPNDYRVFTSGGLRYSIDPSSVFMSAPKPGPNEMTIPELRRAAEEDVQQGRSPHGYLLALHRKFSIPVACFIFAVVALPLGLNNRRDGKMASFVVGIAVIFVYYILMYSGEALAKGQLLSAWAATWLPNVLLGPAAVILLVQGARPGAGRLLSRLPWIGRRGTGTGSADEGDAAGRRSHGRSFVLVLRVPRSSLPWLDTVKRAATGLLEWRPSMIDLYIGRLYLRVFAVAALALLGIFYLAEFIDLQEKLFKGSATLSDLASYFRLATPKYFYFVLPIAGLISTLVTIGILTKNSELVVMKACGISLYRIAVPMLIFGMLLTGAVLGIQEGLLPTTNHKAEELRHRMRGLPPQTFDVLNRRWVVGRQGDIYHYVHYDPRRHELLQLSVYEFDPSEWRLARRVFAERATFDASSPDDQPRWIATKGWVREFAGRTDIGRHSTFDSRPLTLEPPEYFGTETPNSERMNYVRLRDYVADLKSGGYDVSPYEVQLYQKLAFPFVALIMTLIAVPFAVTTGRRGALYGIGVGIILSMVYWVSSQVFAAMGAGGLVAPILAAWAPNILFAGGAAYLLLTVRT